MIRAGSSPVPAPRRRSGYPSADGTVPPIRPARHLHAAVQHRADRGDARPLPRQAARRPAGRRSTTGSSACSRRCSTCPSWSCRRSSGSCRTGCGHHRVMLYGPIFGADRGGHHRPDRDWQHRSRSTSMPVLGLTRLLEGASTAASVPSILGFIALATAGNEILRGKAAARFEGATLAGLGVGFIVAPDPVRSVWARTRSSSTPSSTASRSSSTGVASRTRPARPRRSQSPHVGFEPLYPPHPLVARPPPGAHLDRPQREHRAVVQPVALPVLARRTRSSPTSS